MASIPFDPTGASPIRSGAARVQFPRQGTVDVSTFVRGLIDTTKSFQAKEASGAHNKGLSASFALQARALPKILEFQRKHEGEDNFDELLGAFIEDTIQEESANVDLTHPKALAAFNTGNSRFGLKLLMSGLKAGAEASIADKQEDLATNAENIVARGTVASDIRQPGPTVIPSDLEQEQIALAAIFEDASDPEAGHMRRDDALEAFTEASRRLAIKNLQQKHKDNAELLDLTQEDDFRLSVLRVGKDLMPQFDPSGAPRHESVVPTSTERGELAEFVNKRSVQRRSIETELRQTLEKEVDTFRAEVMSQVVPDVLILGGTDHTLRASQLTLPGHGTVMTFDDLKKIHDLELSEQKRRDMGVEVSNRPFVVKLLIAADEGNIGLDYMTSQTVLENVNKTDSDKVIAAITANKKQRKDRNYDEYRSRRSSARSRLSRVFQVSTLFDFGKGANAVYPSVLGQYNSRVNQAYDDAVEAGDSVLTVDPEQIATDLISENKFAFFSALVPEAEKQAQALGVYIRRAPVGPNNSLHPVFVELRKDFESGAIGQAVYEQQLFLLQGINQEHYAEEGGLRRLKLDVFENQGEPIQIATDDPGTRSAGAVSVKIDALLAALRPFNAAILRFMRTHPASEVFLGEPDE